jgi:hypothetical protein
MTEYSPAVSIINDGTFNLDPGAIFGLSPKNVWSKYYEINADYRIKLNTNLTIIQENKSFYLLDGGIGDRITDYYKKWFGAESSGELKSYMKKKKITKFHMIFHTHLHFDHAGHSFSDLSGSKSVASIAEINNFRDPIEMAKTSYNCQNASTINLSPVFGDTQFGNFYLKHTGGHTTGHMAIFYRNGNTKIVYAGDLFPSTFHLKPSRITAIDQEPLKSYRAKKEILAKAIKESWILVLSHDLEEKAIRVSGDVEDPRYTPWEGT